MTSPYPRRLSGSLLLIVPLLSMCLSPKAQGVASTQEKVAPAKPDNSNEAFLLEEAFDLWSFENDGTYTHDSRFKVRIQSDAGVQRFSILMLPYEKSSETLEIRTIRVRKPDGSVVVTPPEDFQDMPSEIARSAPQYTDTREKHIPVKGLRTGDELEFEGRWKRNKAILAGHFWLAAELNEQEVVLDRTFQVSVPRDRALKMKSALPPQISEEGSRKIYTWRVKREKPEEVSALDLAQQNARGRLPAPDLMLSTFQSWDEVGRWYEQLQKDRAQATPGIRERAAELTREMKEPLDKVKALYRYVSLEYRYVGVSFGVGRYQPHSAEEVFNNQYGDCKDKHTLLSAMLSSVGISSYPALIGSSRAIEEDVPSPAQFDHVITAVPLAGEVLWLDTTAEVGPFRHLIPQLRDKPALVAYADRPPRFERTPIDPPKAAKWTYAIDAKLDESGTLTGKVEQSVQGDLEMDMRSTLRRLPRTRWKDLIQQISFNLGFGGEVSDVVISAPEATETPLTISYTYKREKYSDWENRRISPPAPFLLGLPPEQKGKLPSTFWLGSPGEFLISTKVELPRRWSITLPAPAKVDLQVPGTVEYHSVYKQEGGHLLATYRITLIEREVAGAKVRDYKAFAESVFKDRSQFLALSSPAQTAEEAIGQVRRAVWALPDSEDEAATASEAEAQEQLRRGSPYAAVSHLQKAVQADAKFMRAWISLAQVQVALGQTQSGIDSFRRAIDSNPEQPLSYKLMAYALMSLNRHKEAEQAWLDLEKVAPGDRDVATNLSGVLRAQGRYREAIPYLEKAVENYPDNVRQLAALAWTYLKDGQDERANQIYERVVRLKPDHGTKNDIAYELSVMTKKLDLALALATESVAEVEAESSKLNVEEISREQLRVPQSLAASWDTLGWVHFRLGNLAEAEEYLSAAWALLPIRDVAYHRGMTLERLGRRAEAIRMYRFAVGDGFSEANSAKEARKRLEELKSPLPRPTISNPNAYGAELSNERTIPLPRLTSKESSAEFYVVLALGPKVEEVKFISGSDTLKEADKTLRAARFKAVFPKKSNARILRKGILGCYPVSGCSFVLYATDDVAREQ